MPNERLHNAMREVGITVQDLAGAADVDPKTVGRWLTQDRIPYPRHRRKVAARIGTVTGYLENLLRLLAESHFASSELAIELSQRIREFNSIAPLGPHFMEGE